MKIILKENKVTMVDNDRIVIVEENIDRIKKNSRGERWLMLPENSVNRQYTNLDKLIKLGTIDYGDEVKEKRTITHSGDKPSKSATSWLNYLTDDERKTLEDIKAKATARMNDPLEQLLKQKRELEAKIAELQSKGTK